MIGSVAEFLENFKVLFGGVFGFRGVEKCRWEVEWWVVRVIVRMEFLRFLGVERV